MVCAVKATLQHDDVLGSSKLDDKDMGLLHEVEVSQILLVMQRLGMDFTQPLGLFTKPFT